MLETAADAPIASPLRGVILSPLQDPDAEEEVEDGLSRAVGSKRTEGGWKGTMGERHGRRIVGDGGRSSSSSSRGAEEERIGATELHVVLDKARGVRGAGEYMEQTLHGQGKVKSVCAGVKVGTGLGLYHKFAQGETQANEARPCRSCLASRVVVMRVRRCLFCRRHVNERESYQLILPDPSPLSPSHTRVGKPGRVRWEERF